MTILSDYVSRMVDGGMAIDEAMQIAAELFAAGVASAGIRPSSGALRTRKWREKQRHQPSQNVTCDAPKTEIENVTERHKASQSVTCDSVPLYTTKTDIENKKDKRGARLSPEWSPSDVDRTYAKTLSWTDEQIDREAENFRDYWIARAGVGGLKLDWPATWRKWIRNSKSQPAGSTRPLTVHQQRQLESKEALDALRNASRRQDFGVQRHDPSDGQASLRGGVRGAIIDLSAARDREGHEPVDRSAGDGQLSELGKVSGAS